MAGRISFLVSAELRTLLQSLVGFDKEQRAQVRRATRTAAAPIWKDETRERVQTRLQTRVLSDTARVAVSDSNVTLKSGGVGKLANGFPVSVLAQAAEFGANPNKLVAAKSSKGTAYKRRMGSRFGSPRRKGNVVHPAAGASIPRFAALWIQTTVRTLHEALEKGGAK